MGTNHSAVVVDLFAGPGGLGEGFSSLKIRGAGHPFSIGVSVEKDSLAQRTLRLRSFYRQFAGAGKRIPELYYNVLRGAASENDIGRSRYSEEWADADREAIHAELGTDAGDALVEERINSEKLHRPKTDVILIGGPPCQAYSLVGRSRNRGIVGYRAEDDGRHVLYQQYLQVLKKTRPVAFVMENVKGILSSKLDGSLIFPRILEDLQDPFANTGHSGRVRRDMRYRLTTVCAEQESQSLLLSDQPEPSSFLVRAEDHGVPQRRHRVFVIGIREDIPGQLPKLEPRNGAPSVWDAIGDLPPVLAGVSRRAGSDEEYADARLAAAACLSTAVLRQIHECSGNEVADACRLYMDRASGDLRQSTESFLPCGPPAQMPEHLKSWTYDRRLGGVCNHVAKTHMPSDLARYLFAAAFAERRGYSPKLGDFPEQLLPQHANAQHLNGQKAIFEDRFRVQVRDQPSTTVTSHISKDGHYFIHPDPMQCRSLTVREAARLQTFPDNYFFCGPKTAQYHQVGNAVPPLLASQIAKSLHAALF